jgi:hypothetical protein
MLQYIYASHDCFALARSEIAENKLHNIIYFGLGCIIHLPEGSFLNRVLRLRKKFAPTIRIGANFKLDTSENCSVGAKF